MLIIKGSICGGRRKHRGGPRRLARGIDSKEGTWKQEYPAFLDWREYGPL